MDLKQLLLIAGVLFLANLYFEDSHPNTPQNLLPNTINEDHSFACATDEMHQQRMLNDVDYKNQHDLLDHQIHEYLLNQNQAMLPFLANYTLPVVVHIIHNNGNENISDAVVLQGIADLNNAFENVGYYNPSTGVNTQVAFCLAKRDPDGNATTGITRDVSSFTEMNKDTDDLTVKDLNRWDPTSYINIWLVKEICSNSSGCGVAGYAYFPSAHGSGVDGIMMEARWFGSSQGKSGVTIHEMGHYLGVYHTFQGGCTNNDCLTDGDRVCDTPPDQSTAPVPCAGTSNSCNTDTNSGFATDQEDMFINYMDYGDFNCYSAFTQGQADRMDFFINTTRTSLLNSNACNDPCLNPITAAFTVVNSTVNSGTTVNFTNTTINGTNYSWEIDGINFSNGTNASYTFNTLGTFTIELIADNADPNCTNSFSMEIEVVCPVEANFTNPNTSVLTNQTINFVNTSTNVTSYEWFVSGVSVSTAANFSTSFPTQGTYEICLEATNGLCISTKCQLIQVVGGLDADILNFYKRYGNGLNNIFSKVMYDPSEAVFYVAGRDAPGGADQLTPILLKLDGCGEIIWSRSFTKATFLQSLVKSPDGNIVIHGRTRSSANDYKQYVAKLDPNGNLIWAKSYDRTGRMIEEELEASIGDPIGESYFIRHWKSSGGSSDDMSVFKIDGNGNVLWAKDFSGSGDEQMSDLVALPGGGCKIIGSASSIAWDALVMTLDNNGNMLSSFRYGSSDPILTREAVLMDDGGLVISGYLQPSSSQKRPFLFRIDGNGDPLWQHKYEISGEVSHHQIIKDIHGDLYTSGYATVNGAPAYRVFKFTPDGDFIWAKKVGNTGVASSSYLGGAEVAHTNTFPDRIICFNYLNGGGFGDLDPWLAVLDTALSSCQTVDFNPVNTSFNVTKSNTQWSVNDVSYIVSNESLEEDVDYSVSEICAISCAEEICDNGIDDDGDGLIDCEDETCVCVEICDNGLDDDGDGLIDCFDPDCCADLTCIDNYYNPCPIDCEYNIPSNDLDLELEWNSASNWHSYNVPFVADIDNDGIPEVINKQGPHASGVGYHKDIQILNGVDGTLKNTITTPYVRYSNSHVTIGDVDLDGFGEMIINTSYGSNGFANRMRLICYEHDGTQKWISDTEYGYNDLYEWSMPLLTDFNEDGIPEVYIGNQIFNALTGEFLVEGGTGMNEGKQVTNLGSGISNILPIAADVLPSSFCADCQGKELVAGNQVIAVNLSTNQMSVVMELSGSNIKDGLTSIADMDMDGDLDAIVGTRDGNKGVVYVWDLQTPTQMGYTYEFVAQASNCCQGTTSQIIVGDFDNDNAPEMAFSSANEFRCLEFSPNDDFTVKWLISSTDNSGQTGATLFDFQADGSNEVLYRDQTTLRVLDGSTGNVITSIGCNSGTGTEYPIVVDVDADGESEILCSCDNQVKVYGSASGPWAPSRQVWNQQSYFNVNINDDLSIPRKQQGHHLVGDGVVMNTFLAQYSDPDFPVPDAVLTVDSLWCEQLEIGIRLRICNTGDQILSNETPISFYQGDPQNAVASVVASQLLGEVLPVDSCIIKNFTIPGLFGEDIFVVINDDNSLATPYSLANDFPVTEIPECDFTNNIDSFNIAYSPALLDLGPDVIVCANGVFQFDAGSGFQSYLWQDGSVDSSYTAFEPGKYWVTAKDFCGNIQSDTVMISVDSITIFDLGLDTVICWGDSISLSVLGFDHYDWYPKVAINCDTCSTVFIKPDVSTNYKLVAYSDLGCYSVDSIQISLIYPVETYDTLSICAGDTIDVFGDPVSVTGDYSAVFDAFNGCDSTSFVTVIGLNDTIFTIEMPVICEGDSVEIFGNYESQAGIFVQVDTSENCAKIDSVFLTVLDSIIVEVFDTICEGNSIEIFGNTVTSAGDYVGEFTRFNTCDSLHIIHLSVLDTFASFDTLTICETETVPIFGVETGTEGSYQQTYSGSNTCDSTAYVWLNVLDTILLRDTVIVCFGESALIFGNLESVSGNYFQQNTAFNGCDSTDIMTLIVLDDIELNLTTIPSCAGMESGSVGSNVTGGLAPYEYFWGIPDANQADRTNLGPGTYGLTVTDANGCTQSGSATVNSTGGVNVDLMLEDLTCFGETDGAMTVTSLDTTLLYSLDGINYSMNNQFDLLGAGTYTLYVKDSNNCVFEEIFDLINPTELLVSLPNDMSLQLGDSVAILAIPNTLDSVGYNWTPPISLSCLDCPEPVVTPLNSIAYTVIITDENGCTASDDILIQVDKERLVYIPNAFSPDGDGRNDYFMVYGGQGVESILEFKIFDRWGNVVYGAENFQANDLEKGWDGSFKGKPMNTGIYVYLAQVKFVDGTTILYKGDITLLR